VSFPLVLCLLIISAITQDSGADNHPLTHSLILSLSPSLSLSVSVCVLETALRTDLVGYHDFFFLASSAKSDFLERDYQSSGRFQRFGRFQ
jgi:hypothetical protein